MKKSTKAEMGIPANFTSFCRSGRGDRAIDRREGGREGSKRTGATGPKVSSLVMTMPVVTSARPGSSKKVPPKALHLPPVTTLPPS